MEGNSAQFNIGAIILLVLVASVISPFGNRHINPVSHLGASEEALGMAGRQEQEGGMKSYNCIS